MPALGHSIKVYDTDPANNDPDGTDTPSTLDDSIRALAAAVRDVFSGTTVASATTCDIGAVDATVLTISGTTTITGFGTVSAGIWKLLYFSGALTLTHNATSLILPTASNITTVAGDCALVVSLGSGNWRCWAYQRTSSLFPASLTSGYFLTNNGTTLSWAVPAASLSSLTAATGANTLANGVNYQTWGWTGAHGASDRLFKLTGSSTTPTNATLLTLEGNVGEVLRAVSTVTTAGSPTLLMQGNGLLSYSGGTRTDAGDAANITITAAYANSGGAGAGGSVTIAAGNAGSGTAGSATLRAGNSTSGTDGTAQIDASDSSAQFQVNTTHAKVAGTTKLVLDQKHVYVDNTNGAPTISAGGGSGATIAGSDVAFEVVAGTGSPTSVTVTFANAHASAPQVVLCSTSQAGCRLNYAATTTTVQILTDSAWSSGAKISVLVLGLQ